MRWWRKIKAKWNALFDWIFGDDSREDSAHTLDYDELSEKYTFFCDEFGSGGKSNPKAVIFFVILALIIIPIIFLVIWLDGYIRSHF